MSAHGTHRRRVRVKICGITHPADALLAADLGADAVGLNFYPGSPRCISTEVAKDIVHRLPPWVTPVAVVVQPDAALLERLAVEVAIHWVQIHAGSASVLSQVVHRLRLHTILAWGIAGPEDLQALQEEIRTWQSAGVVPRAILVDARVPGQFGGTGRTAPWSLIGTLTTELPLVLAGGLDPDNVTQAIRLLRPYAVDVASGVEASPGRKDPVLLARFMQAVAWA